MEQSNTSSDFSTLKFMIVLFNKNLLIYITLVFFVISCKENQPQSDLTPPAIPKDLVLNVGDSFVELNWKANSEPDLKHYRLLQNDPDATDPKLLNVATILSKTITKYKVDNLDNEKTYRFSLEAVDLSNNISGKSKIVTATPIHIDKEAPAVPSGLMATPGDSSVLLNWTLNTETDLTNYLIFQGESSSTMTKIATLSKDTDNYEVMKLNNDTPYYFSIAAQDNFGNVSNQSEVISVTPKAISLTVQLVQPTATTITNGIIPIEVSILGNFPERVELLFDGEPFIDLTEPYYTDLDTSTLAEKEYSLQAQALIQDKAFLSDSRTIIVDRTSPQVLSKTPENAAKNVDLADPIIVRFNEALDSQTISQSTVSLQTSEGIELTKTLNLDSTGKILTLLLDVAPPTPSTLEMSLESTIKDLAGNSLVEQHWSWDIPEWVQLGGPLDTDEANIAERAYISTGPQGVPFVVWHESINNKTNIFVKRWNGNNWVNVGASLNMDPTQNALNAKLVVGSDGNPIVVWHELFPSKSDLDVFVKRWNGSSWQTLGGPLGIDPLKRARNAGIALDSHNNPVISWYEFTSPDETTQTIYAKHWTGIAWEQLGSHLDFNENQIAHGPMVAIDSKDVPYVAWYEVTTTVGPRKDDVFVKRWNGSNWEQVGSSLDVMTDNDANNPSIAIDSDNAPVVSWSEEGDIRVKRWNGLNWVALGNALDSNSTNNAGRPKVVINNTNVPYVTWYEEEIDSFATYVKYWTGNAWENLGGDLSISSSETETFPVIALDQKQNPLVAWQELTSANSNIYVKRYNTLSQ